MRILGVMMYRGPPAASVPLRGLAPPWNARCDPPAVQEGEAEPPRQCVSRQSLGTREGILGVIFMQHWPHATLASCNTGLMQHWPHATLASCNTGLMQHWPRLAGCSGGLFLPDGTSSVRCRPAESRLVVLVVPEFLRRGCQQAAIVSRRRQRGV